MMEYVLNPFDMVKVLGNELKTGFSHIVSGQIYSCHSFYC